MSIWRNKRIAEQAPMPPIVVDMRRPASAVSAAAKKKTRKFTKRFWLAASGIGILLIVAVATYMYSISDARDEQLPAGGEAAAKAVAKRVSRHFVLPSDELPALAT